ncbi:MAG: hypothetical protein ACREA0_14945 [bacterium]
MSLILKRKLCLGLMLCAVVISPVHSWAEVFFGTVETADREDQVMLLKTDIGKKKEIKTPDERLLIKVEAGAYVMLVVNQETATKINMLNQVIKKDFREKRRF